MREPSAPELLESLRALPAAAPLLDHLRGRGGVYLVGGAVRDLLLGVAPLDLDLVVEGNAAALARELGDDVRVHDRFGTSTVRLDGHAYDLASARAETYARPGALPDVRPASLREDLSRRDFTVNAIALALGGERPGELIAAEDALADLQARRLRVLHDLSFVDDPTRLLRLARYRARLRFAIEAHTADLAARAVAAGALGTVTGPRIGNELRLLAREPDPLAGFAALEELGIAAAIAPGLGIPDPAATARSLALLPADGRRDLTVLAAAARAVEPPTLAAVLDELGFEAGERDTIVGAATRAGMLGLALAAAGRPSQVAAVARGASPEQVALAGGLGGAGAAHRARVWFTQLRHVTLEIDGSDLLAAGVPQGPAVGQGLRAALAAKLDGLAEGRDRELEIAQEAAGRAETGEGDAGVGDASER